VLTVLTLFQGLSSPPRIKVGWVAFKRVDPVCPVVAYDTKARRVNANPLGERDVRDAEIICLTLIGQALTIRHAYRFRGHAPKASPTFGAIVGYNVFPQDPRYGENRQSLSTFSHGQTSVEFISHGKKRARENAGAIREFLTCSTDLKFETTAGASPGDKNCQSTGADQPSINEISV
jgi:hypothetical protein